MRKCWTFHRSSPSNNASEVSPLHNTSSRPKHRGLMIWPQFSEFSFGYALTDNLVNKVLTGSKGVPVFPSLQEEGKQGGGYDVKIPLRSAPLFLQFKLPQIVRRHRNVWGH